MKINRRQEIAMWVLGLGWTALALFSFIFHGDAPVLAEVPILLVLLVPIALVVFTLRDRRKPN